MHIFSLGIFALTIEVFINVFFYVSFVSTRPIHSICVSFGLCKYAVHEPIQWLCGQTYMSCNWIMNFRFLFNILCINRMTREISCVCEYRKWPELLWSIRLRHDLSDLCPKMPWMIKENHFSFWWAIARLENKRYHSIGHFWAESVPYSNAIQMNFN